jgi:hypothetical protein
VELSRIVCLDRNGYAGHNIWRGLAIGKSLVRLNRAFGKEKVLGYRKVHIVFDNRIWTLICCCNKLYTAPNNILDRMLNRCAFYNTTS